LRIVFAGTPANAGVVLSALVSAGLDIVGVLTRRDAPIGRKATLNPSPVAEVAEALRIRVLKANHIGPDEISWLNSLEPDLGVIVAYGSILKREALQVPKRGWVNLHYSLLPKHPGASPIQQTILNGDQTSGATVFRLDEGVDSGPVLAQTETEVGERVRSEELLVDLTAIGSKLLIDTLRNFDNIVPIPQEKQAPLTNSYAKKISRDDARIDFSKTAIGVDRLVRAMYPEPMAWCELNAMALRVLEGEPVESTALRVGEVQVIDSKVLVGCGEGALQLISVQPSGRTKMSGPDWFRGLQADTVILS
jgi:methionyl-tRNA formyltransferase